jgi:hypothetical protein
MKKWLRWFIVVWIVGLTAGSLLPFGAKLRFATGLRDYPRHPHHYPLVSALLGPLAFSLPHEVLHHCHRLLQISGLNSPHRMLHMIGFGSTALLLLMFGSAQRIHVIAIAVALTAFGFFIEAAQLRIYHLHYLEWGDIRDDTLGVLCAVVIFQMWRRYLTRHLEARG